MADTLVSSAQACLCGGSRFTPVFTYTAPPAGEMPAPGRAGKAYWRQVVRCEGCGHFLSRHDWDDRALYQGGYVDATYDGAEGIRRAFKRIIALDPAKSDNAGRVRRLLEFADSHWRQAGQAPKPPSVLDVGSGLCVFLHRMKAAGWACTAVDPDPRAVAHARETVGVQGVCGDLLAVRGLGAFDVITFNKVLEHVSDPVGMLAKSARHLRASGFVYVEVPDGELAAREGPGREEFFIEHLHVFSAASLALLAARAGFQVRRLERLREPSGKHTLWACVTP